MNPWSLIAERTRPEHDRFRHALLDSRAAQKTQLEDILHSNQNTVIGRRHDFGRIRDLDEYRARVPVHRYTDLAELISAHSSGVDGQVVSRPVIAYEETSGSTSSCKLIPYTRSALDAFARAVHPWLHDLLCHRPALTRGRVYFSISPPARPTRYTPDGTSIGMTDDAAYFGGRVAGPLTQLMAAPPELVCVRDIESWRYLTLRCLLDADDLTLLSVWSPTFLSVLLADLSRHGCALADDIERGHAVAPHGTALTCSFPPRPARAGLVREALAGSVVDTTALWPLLDLVSCWTDGNAARFIPRLRREFPGVEIQGKGLLATEGVMSVPLIGEPAPVLAVNSAFYEFLDDDGRSHLADELAQGTCYQVVLTTHGGLYRYDIGDRVRVRGYLHTTPLLEFVGRGDRVSDICGEKLDELQVQRSLASLAGFALLAPDLEDRPHYRLLLDSAEHDDGSAVAVAARVECSLRENPQYDLARRLGQLAPVSPARRSDALSRYLAGLNRLGQRVGDIKPPLLCCDAGWKSMFEEH